jgi:hypothetical protein
MWIIEALTRNWEMMLGCPRRWRKKCRVLETSKTKRISTVKKSKAFASV